MGRNGMRLVTFWGDAQRARCPWKAPPRALDQAPPSGRLVVDCAADGQGAWVQWRFEANDRGGATALAAGCSVPDRDRLTPAGVDALCRRFAARFEPDPAVGTLHLAASSALPSAT